MTSVRNVVGMKNPYGAMGTCRGTRIKCVTFLSTQNMMASCRKRGRKVRKEEKIRKKRGREE